MTNYVFGKFYKTKCGQKVVCTNIMTEYFRNDRDKQYFESQIESEWQDEKQPPNTLTYALQEFATRLCNISANEIPIDIISTELFALAEREISKMSPHIKLNLKHPICQIYTSIGPINIKPAMIEHKPKRKVTYYCYESFDQLRWVLCNDLHHHSGIYKRIPSLDKIVEVES